MRQKSWLLRCALTVALLSVGMGGLMSPQFAAHAQVPAELDLYADAMAGGWTIEHIDGTTVEQSSLAHDGTSALAITHAPQIGKKVIFRALQELSWDSYDMIQFWINGGPSGGQALSVRLLSGQPSPYTPPQESAGYPLPALPANTWVHYAIPILELGATYNIAAIEFQSTNITQTTYLVDSIHLGAKPAGPEPTKHDTVAVAINTSADRHPISPYIYGVNKDFRSVAQLPARRLGGNRTTAYNWENNISNAGSDMSQPNEPTLSDNFMCYAWSSDANACNGLKAGPYRLFHQQSLAQDAYSLLTVPMAGYVAHAFNTHVATQPPSPDWDAVVYAKGAPFTLDPDPNDGVVYDDEMVNALVQEFGPASGGAGVRGYSLDNEPALWSGTHHQIHPGKLTYTELISRSIALSRAIKAVDGSAEVFGPAAYGFDEFFSLQGATDPNDPEQTSHRWFLDYYLDKMRQASISSQRLLDVLDLHWYPEAHSLEPLQPDGRRPDGTRIVFGHVGTGSRSVQEARLQAPRSLWDPTYLEHSWIARNHSAFLPLLPEVQQSIATYYPGTKLAITEFDYGGDHDITGGIATADVLGIFGRERVYMANFWNEDANYDPVYTASAYKLYRDYDGLQSTYGDTNVGVSLPVADRSRLSVYAAENDDASELHLIVLNKTMDTVITNTFAIDSATAYASGSVWGFNAQSWRIRQAAPISGIQNNQFSYAVPPLTAYHIVLRTNPPRPTYTPTLTRTPRPTYTPTPTPTPKPLESCRVAYSVAGSWLGNFQGNVTLFNTGSTSVNGWELNWTFADGQQITTLWNADHTQDGATVRVHSSTGQGALPAGGSASFGFNATVAGANTIPTSFTLNGVACATSVSPTVTPDDPTVTPGTVTPTPVESCVVSYTMNAWDTAFQATVVLTNTGSTSVNGWDLSWTFANGQVITQTWETALTQNGATVHALNPSWAPSLAARGSASFGFNARTGNGPNTQPTSFTLNGVGCQIVSPADPEPTEPTVTPTPTPTASAMGGCVVSYVVDNTWSNNFHATVVVTNTSSLPINGWDLGWTFADGQTIAQLWQAQLVQSGASVHVHNYSWRPAIAAGASITFDFQGTLPSTQNTRPTSFLLNGASCVLQQST